MATPEGWQEARLGDVCRLEYGRSLPSAMRRPGRVLVYGSNGVVGEHDEALVVGPGIVVGRKGSIGEVAWAPSDFWPIDTAYYVVSAEFADRHWLYQLLASLGLRSLNSATGVPGLNRDDVHNLPLRVPPIPEQRKIAAILSSIDETIEKTEAVIAQLQVLKKAMMQELLTRGMPGRHTRFKQTEIGQIPEEWEVMSVGDIPPSGRPTAQTGPFGAQLGAADFVAEGVPVLKIGNVRAGWIDLSNLDYVTPQKAAELERFRIRTGDLLFARQGATTGRNALADENCDGAIINYHIIRVAIDGDKCDPRFLAACFSSTLVRSQVDGRKMRGNRDGINTADIMAMRLPRPSLLEQQQVSDTLASLDANRATEERVLEALRATKAALSASLLSGELRVSPDEATE